MARAFWLLQVNEDIVISVEVTTSRGPIGMVDQRMAGTLDKLSHLPGKRVYYVGRPEMRQRAETKIRKAGHDIEVRMLGIEAGSQLFKPRCDERSRLSGLTETSKL